MNKYTITDEEAAILDGMKGTGTRITTQEHLLKNYDAEQIAFFCFLRGKLNEILMRRNEALKTVVDAVAEAAGLTPCERWRRPKADGSVRLAEIVKERLK